MGVGWQAQEVVAQASARHGPARQPLDRPRDAGNSEFFDIEKHAFKDDIWQM